MYPKFCQSSNICGWQWFSSLFIKHGFSIQKLVQSVAYNFTASESTTLTHLKIQRLDDPDPVGKLEVLFLPGQGEEEDGDDRHDRGHHVEGEDQPGLAVPGHGPVEQVHEDGDEGDHDEACHAAAHLDIRQLGRVRQLATELLAMRKISEQTYMQNDQSNMRITFSLYSQALHCNSMKAQYLDEKRVAQLAEVDPGGDAAPEAVSDLLHGGGHGHQHHHEVRQDAGPLGVVDKEQAEKVEKDDAAVAVQAGVGQNL